MLSHLARPIFASALFLSAAGCSTYRLGTAGDTQDVQNLFIAPVESNGLIPQSSAIFTTQIRDAFLRDARVRVVNSPEEADAVLNVSLVRADRQGQVGSRIATGVDPNAPQDLGRARKFEQEVVAHLDLASPDGAKTYFTDREVRVERQLYTDGGQQLQAEYNLVPQLAEPLARAVRGAVVDTW
jgi:hypothetical protein